MLLTYLQSIFTKANIQQNWESVSARERDLLKEQCLSLFNNYINATLEFSDKLLEDRKLVAAIINQNPRKSYEYLMEFENLNDYNVEIYNPRLELLTYYGRQLNPETTDLSRASSGETFSSVKEIGLFTYLLVYRPVRGDTLAGKDNLPGDEGHASGILVVSRLIDVDYPLKNKFFRNFGLTSQIAERTGVNVDIKFSRLKGSLSEIDSNALKESDVFYLTGVGNKLLGLVYAPRPDRMAKIEDVEDMFTVWFSVEAFVLSCIVLLMVLFGLKRFRPNSFLSKNYLLKTIIVLLTMVGVRYFWLTVGFPQRLIESLDVRMFSPSFYASTFGFGIARSIGEILLTSILVLIFCLHVLTQVMRFSQTENLRYRMLTKGILIVLGLVMIFGSLQAYGFFLNSMVFDSNLKFFDRLQVISTAMPELLLAQLTIIIISVSLVISVLSGSILMSTIIAHMIPMKSIFYRHIVLFLFAGLILLNNFLPFAVYSNAVFALSTGLRNLILILSGLFVYYFYRRMTVERKYSYAGLLNTSLTLLICAAIIPEALLGKMTSQENKYIELIARKLSEQGTDKAMFTLVSNLEDIADDYSLASDILDKDKSPSLAFRIWSKSKLSSENFNAAVYVLDTAKRVISDFNTNPAGLNSDSVIKAAFRTWHLLHGAQPRKPESALQENEGEEQDEIFDELGIENVFENPELRCYYGVRPVERIDLRNSMFRNVVGYVIFAVQYDSRKYFSESGSELFSDFGRDNLENKLISPPVISEFTNGELVGSSDREMSKSFFKSIAAFREAVRDKIDKSSWRYDQVEGTAYKSFYILTNQSVAGGIVEKIFVVSSPVNDLGSNIFFVFKNLIFVVVVYIIFLIAYVSYRLVLFFRLPRKSRQIIFGYREKLFAAFFLVSVIPVIILAAYTRQFVENKNTEFYKEQLISDLKIVSQYIIDRIPAADIVKKGYYRNLPADSINIFGKGFPEVHKNFNLFVRSKLVSTTNEELYKSGLLDARLDANAFYNIALLKKDYFVTNQEIGDFKFIVGYKPVFDAFNNLLGIVSSQTFFNQYEINQELTESLVYILGTYIVAVVSLVFVVNILSYRISNPVIKLLRATEQLSKGNVEIQVKSKAKDEIGELVKSFNKMILELKRSRDELKRAERESAWRDIARQVAHEIKNPLTPIKLAMQHLYSSYMSHPKDFKTVLQTTHQMIIDQIESLNRIASEFSDFARMPSRNYRAVTANQVVTEVVNLFRSSRIQFTVNLSDGEVTVLGDPDELRRALINVIRNSIQAIEQRDTEDFQGRVDIDTYTTGGYYLIKIKDNGIGMNEETLQKLFEPYFSTKSKGMGLGLVITKKIISEMQGEIVIHSFLNQGTEVQIKLKIFSAQSSEEEF